VYKAPGKPLPLATPLALAHQVVCKVLQVMPGQRQAPFLFLLQQHLRKGRKGQGRAKTQWLGPVHGKPGARKFAIQTSYCIPLIFFFFSWKEPSCFRVV